MNRTETIRSAAAQIAPGSRFSVEVIEAVMSALCALAEAEGMKRGVEEAHASVLAHLAIDKASHG